MVAKGADRPSIQTQPEKLLTIGREAGGVWR
jgi:hypothetical protein